MKYYRIFACTLTYGWEPATLRSDGRWDHYVNDGYRNHFYTDINMAYRDMAHFQQYGVIANRVEECP